MGWFGGFVIETYNRVPGDFEEVDIGIVAGALSADKVLPPEGKYKAGARAALVSSELGDIRFRLDGGAPTAEVGHFLTAGDVLGLMGGQAMQQFKAIRTGETDAKLFVTYFY